MQRSGHRRLGPIGAVAALACIVVAAASGGSGATPPVRVTFVGDSVADALAYMPTAERAFGRGYDVAFDLRVCRRLATAGCPYRGTVPSSALDEVYASGEQTGQVLVVDVGYNDDPALYRKGMDDLVQTAGALGVKRIVWVTLRETQSIFRQTNAVIRSEAKRYPQVEVADWNACSAGKPWFRSDGLHLTPAGATALAAWLRPYVVRAAAEARATA
jgi:hypothetical protein